MLFTNNEMAESDLTSMMGAESTGQLDLKVSLREFWEYEKKIFITFFCEKIPIGQLNSVHFI